MVVECLSFCIVVFFFKQKTAYEMRISDWSSDVCSSDLSLCHLATGQQGNRANVHAAPVLLSSDIAMDGNGRTDITSREYGPPDDQDAWSRSLPCVDGSRRDCVHHKFQSDGTRSGRNRYTCFEWGRYPGDRNSFVFGQGSSVSVGRGGEM